MSNSNEKVNNSNDKSTNEIKSRVKGMTACRAPKDDYISRQEAIDVCMKYNGQGYVWSCIMGDLRKLPSVQPDPHYDEWCTDCKEYDQERHCCPRWNKVIRETLKDLKPEIIRCKDCEYGEQDEVGRWFCRSLGCQIGNEDGSGYCADAERRTDE